MVQGRYHAPIMSIVPPNERASELEESGIVGQAARLLSVSTHSVSLIPPHLTRDLGIDSEGG